ncbi:MAG: DUF4234 domain-containing protein [Clostridia bacterium]|nr:DUF4234 domain-containing protein [Clostridia bacterium]
MNCKHCNHTIPDNSAFCPSCGQKTETTSVAASGFVRPGSLDGSDPATTSGSMVSDGPRVRPDNYGGSNPPPPPPPRRFCMACGNQLAEGVNFCSVCGADTRSNGGRTAGTDVGHLFVRTPVKTDYSLVAYILLSFITCGIYGWYYIHMMARDTNQICAEDGDKVGGLAAYILLNLVTCGFYSVYWMYKIQNRLYIAGPKYGMPVAETGTTVLVWYLVGFLICGIGSFIAVHYVLKSLNRVGSAYNARYFYGNAMR